MFSKKSPHGNAPSLGVDAHKMRDFRTTVLLDGENVGVIQNMLVYLDENPAIMNDLIRSTSPKAVADTFMILTGEVEKLFKHMGFDTEVMGKNRTAINDKGIIEREKR